MPIGNASAMMRCRYDYAPISVGELSSTFMGIPVDINISLNDLDPDYFPHSSGKIEVYTYDNRSIKNCIVNLSSNKINFQYIPKSNYFGPDEFTYVVTDGIKSSNTSSVKLSVLCLPPVISDKLFNLRESVTYNLDITDPASDPDIIFLGGYPDRDINNPPQPISIISSSVKASSNITIDNISNTVITFTTLPLDPDIAFSTVFLSYQIRNTTCGISNDGDAGTGTTFGSGPLPDSGTGTSTGTFVGTTVGSIDGDKLTAKFNSPRGVTMTSSNILYVADYGNSRIRQVTSTGDVTTYAGSTRGTTDAFRTSAKFFQPAGIDIDSSGNIYIADTLNHLIRKISIAGNVSTLAGAANSPGIVDGTGTTAKFNFPHDLAVDSLSNVYVADTANHLIRKITPLGVVTTLAGSARGYTDGTGISASFYNPYNIDVDSFDNLYITDSSNHTIRYINTTSKSVSTIAGFAEKSGNDDGIGTMSRFNLPMGINVGPYNIVYVSDSLNHRIRRILPTGKVDTIAGSSRGTDDGSSLSAKFNTPMGLCSDLLGNLFIADYGNNRIRKILLPAILTIDPKTGIITDPSGKVTIPGPTDVIVDKSGVVIDYKPKVPVLPPVGPGTGTGPGTGSSGGTGGTIGSTGTRTVTGFMAKSILEVNVPKTFTKYPMLDKNGNFPWDAYGWYVLAFDTQNIPDQFYISSISKSSTIDAFGNSVSISRFYGLIGPIGDSLDGYHGGPNDGNGKFLFYKLSGCDINIWGKTDLDGSVFEFGVAQVYNPSITAVTDISRYYIDSLVRPTSSQVLSCLNDIGISPYNVTVNDYTDVYTGTNIPPFLQFKKI